MGALIVLLLRLVTPLFILKKPLLFTILALVFDALDVVIIDLLEDRVQIFPFLDAFYSKNYDPLDKALDVYYLSFCFYVCFSIKNIIVRKALVFLFVYRLLGVILYEFTKNLSLLFVFANYFENLFLIYFIGMALFKKDVFITRKNLILALVLTIFLKLPQEYLLHMTDIPPWNTIKNALGISKIFES